MLYKTCSLALSLLYSLPSFPIRIIIYNQSFCEDFLSLSFNSYTAVLFTSILYSFYVLSDF